jgi:hypothetical protein
LTFGGVSGPVAAALRVAGIKLGRVITAAPASPQAAFGVQELRPGSSVAVGLASGDVTAGAVGTVTYVDGDRVWAFGHPLDSAGRRSLLLEDAYVYAVIGSPLNTDQSTPYKLAAPGHALGTLTNDAPQAVVGRLGVLPATFPLRIAATDLNSGRVLHRQVQIADESDIGLPTGSSSLTQVAPVALAQAAYDTLRGAPAAQSGDMCVRITLRERRRPLRFCNRYVGGSPGSAGAPMVSDLKEAAGLIDSYKFGVVHVTAVDVSLKLRRDLGQAYLRSATAPGRVRRGGTLRVRMTVQQVRGPRLRRTITVRVPRDARTGHRELVIRGTPSDAPAASSDAQALASVFSVALSSTAASDDPGPRDVSELADAMAAIHRDDGLTVGFLRPGASEDSLANTVTQTITDGRLRLSGTVRVPVRVR